MSQVCVLQHPDLVKLSLADTKQYFSLSQPLSGSVCRIPFTDEIQRLPEKVIAELNAAQVDFAILPDKAFSEMKLLISDMDSTLITIECIDEIAAQAGLKDEVAAITESAMRGELDFEQSLRQRVGLLNGLPETALDEVYQHQLKLTAGAEYLLSECHHHGVTFVLVSGGFTFFTERLKQQLGFQYAHANQLEVINGHLTGQLLGEIVDAQAKAKWLQHYQAQLGCTTEQIIAVGDGANDIPMLQAAGIGMAFHAKPKTQAAAKVAINYRGLEAVRNWFA